jgi:histidine triad (HIT) family protein
VSDCIFCRIVHADLERSVVYEDDCVLVIMDIQPVNEGHALVLPKKHAARLAELDRESADRLFPVAVRAAAALRASGFRCEGVNFFLADGEAAGQEVDHVHVHVLPRFHGDPFRVHRVGGPAASPTRAELDAAASRLREAW